MNYSFPLSKMNLENIKRKENLHIFFWLIKDFCWSLEFKLLGIIMVLPTVSLALIIFWKTRSLFSDAIHNFAVCFWIFANSIWMIGEFSGNDFRIISATFFFIGFFTLLVYYTKIYFFNSVIK